MQTTNWHPSSPTFTTNHLHNPNMPNKRNAQVLDSIRPPKWISCIQICYKSLPPYLIKNGWFLLMSFWIMINHLKHVETPKPIKKWWPRSVWFHVCFPKQVFANCSFQPEISESSTFRQKNIGKKTKRHAKRISFASAKVVFFVSWLEVHQG